ncbi:MAG: class I SAM-dependent methyltransferase [Solirubrobacteraceae bacterium MAG38_C4-C5]|nr:class I SAM-dependent methyltransferase [Candidatus Siliceabacter maunaloa]
MFRFWQTVVEPLLTAARPQVIVEVGAQSGHNTVQLLDFAQGHESTLHVIEPAPEFDTGEFARRYGSAFVLHTAKSLEVLDVIARPDAVLLDGDHNWYTVSRELGLLAEGCRRDDRPFPLVLLHDIGWPYGRRDLYYEPEDIPPADRQPYAKAGLLPESSATVGDRGLNRHLCNAEHDGGPRNGVLTAIEDALRELPGPLAFTSLPGTHGLAILVSEARLDEAPALRGRFEWLQSAEFLRDHARWVEGQRVRELVRVEDLGSHLAEISASEAEVASEHSSPVDTRQLDAAQALQRRSAEQLARQSEDLTASDQLRRQAESSVEELEQAVQANGEQLELATRRAQELEDSRDGIRSDLEAVRLELVRAHGELRDAAAARDAGLDHLRRSEETRLSVAGRADELAARAGQLRSELLRAEERSEDARTALERQLAEGDAARERSASSHRQELAGARRDREAAGKDGAAANRQVALLQARERQLWEYTYELERRVADGEDLAQELCRQLASTQSSSRFSEDESASEVERLGRSVELLQEQLQHSERDAHLATQQALVAERAGDSYAARVEADAAVWRQTLEDVRLEVDRARESRSWRLGHRVMRVLRLLSLRRGRGTDALLKASGRVDAALSVGSSPQRPALGPGPGRGAEEVDPDADSVNGGPHELDTHDTAGR